MDPDFDNRDKTEADIGKVESKANWQMKTKKQIRWSINKP
jgi:hypothetical protein